MTTKTKTWRVLSEFEAHQLRVVFAGHLAEAAARAEEDLAELTVEVNAAVAYNAALERAA